MVHLFLFVKYAVLKIDHKNTGFVNTENIKRVTVQKECEDRAIGLPSCEYCLYLLYNYMQLYGIVIGEYQ